MRTDPRLSASPDRIPPQNIDAERAVLGSMMLSSAAISDVLDAGLGAPAFYMGKHETIFGTLTALYTAGDPVDAITVVDALKRAGELERVGGHLYIHDLLASVGTPASAGHYAEIVRDLGTLREVITAASEVMAHAYSGDDPADVIQQAESLLLSAVRNDEASEHTIGEGVKDAIAQMERDIQGTERRGLATGMAFFDENFAAGGLGKGQLIVVAARPSVGKSALVTCWADHIAASERVLHVSIEMTYQEVGDRVLARHTQTPGRGVPSLTDAEVWARMGKVEEATARTPWIIYDAGTVTASDVVSRARRMAHKGLGLVIVDYLQLMQLPNHANRATELGDVTRSLKVLAKDLNVPVVAVSQLNRDPAKLNRRPILADLRESGAIEQDADIVVFLHREQEHNYTERGKPTPVELMIAKQRNGYTGKSEHLFFGDSMRFEASA